MPRPSAVRAHEVVDVERRLAEERRRALVLQHQQLALDGADGRLGDVAVLGGQLAPSSLGDVRQQRAQVLEVEQQQALVVGDLEGDVEHALLRVVELEQARQQQRPHLGDGGADRGGPARRTGPRTSPGKRVGLVARRGRCPWRARPGSPSASPVAAMPERSPLMSAANTGTPAREKPSASTCSVTVLPVPVAPVTRPWRLANFNVRYWSASCSPLGGTFLPMKTLSSVSLAMTPLRKSNRRPVIGIAGQVCHGGVAPDFNVRRSTPPRRRPRKAGSPAWRTRGSAPAPAPSPPRR